MSDRWFIVRLNPEPWEVGPISVGRGNGRFRPVVGQSATLAAFQNAIKEELDGAGILPGEVELTLFLWRQLYIHETAAGRKRTAHAADATNMQKAIEDALQGILIENDRLVRKITTTIMAQNAECEGLIVVNVKPFEPALSDTIPTRIWNEIQQVAPLPLTEPVPWDDPTHDVMGDIQRIKSKAFQEGIKRSIQPDPGDFF